MSSELVAQRGSGEQMDSIKLGKIAFSLSHAEIPKDLTFDEWQDALINIQRISTLTNWGAGDLLVFGEDTFGEKYAQAVDETGMSVRRLQQSAWVARAVPAENRVDGLSWTHHERVAVVKDRKLQKKLLEQALAEGWPVARLRVEVKNLVGSDTLPPVKPLPAAPAEEEAPVQEEGMEGAGGDPGAASGGIGIEPGQGGGSRLFDYAGGQGDPLSNESDPILDADKVDWQGWTRQGTAAVIVSVIDGVSEAKMLNFELERVPGGPTTASYTLYMNGKKVKTSYSERTAYEEAIKQVNLAEKKGGKK